MPVVRGLLASVNALAEELVLGLGDLAECCQCRQETGFAPGHDSLSRHVCSLRGSYSITCPAAWKGGRGSVRSDRRFLGVLLGVHCQSNVTTKLLPLYMYSEASLAASRDEKMARREAVLIFLKEHSLEEPMAMQLPSSRQSMAESGAPANTVATTVSRRRSTSCILVSSDTDTRMLGEPGEKHTRVTAPCKI